MDFLIFFFVFNLFSGFVQMHTPVTWVGISKREIAHSFLISSGLQGFWKASAGQLSGLFPSANERVAYFICLFSVVPIVSSWG